MDSTFFDHDDLLDEEEDDEISLLFETLDQDHILSVDDYKELMARDQPGILEWKDYPCSKEEVEHIAVRFTFDKAKQYLWSTAKEEINAITSSARRLLGLSEDQSPSDMKIFSIFFAKDSRFAKVLMDKLGIDYVLLLKWLHDSCLQSFYQLSPTNLYNDPWLKSHLFLNEGSNYGIWEQLTEADREEGTLAVGRRSAFLYEQLQNEYNAIGRELCIANRESHIEIVVDDDKVFYQKDRKKETFGLKYTKHVKDNREGFV